MNQYETVFILTPVLSDEQMKETVADSAYRQRCGNPERRDLGIEEDGLRYSEEIDRFLLPARVQG